MSNITTQATIPIIGGTGFLGSHILDAFSTDSHFTVIAASRYRSRRPSSNLTWERCDITVSSEVSRLIQHVQPTIIIHAATPGPFATAKSQLQHYEATELLVHKAKRSKDVLGFIYTGSRDAIANAAGIGPPGLKESDAGLHTFSSGPTPYARSKGACQRLVLDANNPAAISRTMKSKAMNREESFEDVLLTTVICVPGIYGTRDKGITPGVFKLPSMLQLGPNESLHDWIYAENAAYAHVLAAKTLLHSPMDKDSSTKVHGELFFVTDGDPINFWDFARKMKIESGGRRVASGNRVIVVPWALVLILATISEWVSWVLTLGRAVLSFSPNLARHIKEGGVFDISKAQRRLDYRPVVSRDEGIKRSVWWFLQQKRR